MTDEVPAQRRRLDRLLAHGPAAAATPLARGAVSSARPTLALVLLAVAQFMVFLDETVVNVALPSIKTSLDFTQTGLAWVLDAYILIFGGFLLVGGRMADVFGRRRIFALGVAVFGVASLADGLAQSQALLVVARGFQGLGAALWARTSGPSSRGATRAKKNLPATEGVVNQVTSGGRPNTFEETPGRGGSHSGRRATVPDICTTPSSRVAVPQAARQQWVPTAARVSR
jgi:Major Facilitator Superfamily